MGGRLRQVAVGVAMLAVALMAAACGDGDSDDDAADAPTTAAPAETTAATGAPSTSTEDMTGDDRSATTTTAGATTTAAAAGSDDGDGDGPGAGRAVVTIGDQTFDVDLSSGLSQCIALGGAIGGVGPVDGVDGASVSIDLPPGDYETSGEDWDPPSIRVDLGEDDNDVPIDWRAGGDLVNDDPSLAGRSQVDTYSIDGSRASGTATFIDFFQVQLFASGQADEPQPVDGTFEIDCG